MINYIDETLLKFRSCFSREDTFTYFIVITLGLMTASDPGGAAAFIRAPGLDPACCRALLGFFRSTAWSIWGIRSMWISIVASSQTAYMYDGYYVLLGDGTVQSKEGKKMPAVSSVHQDSADVGKAENTLGHLFGCISIVLGSTAKLISCPLIIGLQNFDSIIRSFAPDGQESPKYGEALEFIKKHIRRNKKADHLPHTARIIVDAGLTAIFLGAASILVLDRYFMAEVCFYLSRTMFDGFLYIVTKAKSGCTAYNFPEIDPHKRGPKPKRGAAVHIFELFNKKGIEFVECTIDLYGRKQKIQYYSTKLLWGETNPMEIMFVLVKCNAYSNPIVLATNALFLNPEQAFELYGIRFKIEVMFANLKNAIFGFDCHFWSKDMPKLHGCGCKAVEAELEAVADGHKKHNIYFSMRAIEGFAACSAIAMGIVQIIVLKFSESHKNLWNLIFFKSDRGEYTSEIAAAAFLRKNFDGIIKKYPEMYIFNFISKNRLPAADIDALLDEIA
jgi:hypothetical protein